MVIVVSNLDELKSFAKEFANKLKGNELIALKGDLGAGKTTFTKFVGKELGVKEEIISPTFNIVKIYESKLGPLYHIDAYRLEDLGMDSVIGVLTGGDIIGAEECFNRELMKRWRK